MGGGVCSAAALLALSVVAHVAAPEFRVTEDGPYDVNVTAGRSVSMHCRSHAEPPANVTWYQNGLALDRT